MLLIEEIDDDDVYDITNPTNHNFFANDVLVHNCGEINLRSSQCCNLSEVVIREYDTVESLREKVELAAILGTFQSGLTNFRYLRNIWTKNIEEERLLGVSLTGVMDNCLTSGLAGKDLLESSLASLRDTAIQTNIKWAAILGISPSTAVTTGKPSGCTTLDTKIKTTNGVMSMQELFDLAGVNPFDQDEASWHAVTEEFPQVYDENNDLQNITKLYVNGVSPLVEIEFEDGKKFKFTPNHQLLTTTGWKRVDELTVDDEIISYTQNINIEMKIVSIKTLSPELTVDVEVENTHSYQLENGAVSHNTVSQLTDAASGIHGRFSPYYIRSVRNDKSDPLSDFLISSGVPYEAEVTNNNNWVFSFPMKSPSASRMSDTLSAIEQLEHYMTYATHWAEHNISNTIYVRPNEWLEVAAWVYKNFDDITGVSFLPYSDHIYQQAPYITITEEDYNARIAAFPVVDFADFNTNEHGDNTKGAETLACVAGGCEI